MTSKQPKNRQPFAKFCPLIKPERIDLQGLRVNIVRSTKRKTLSLEVGHDGVKIRAPDRMRERTIRQFVLGKQTWIKQQLAKLPPVVSPLLLEDGCELLLLGESYRLLIAAGRKTVHLDTMARIVVPITASHLTTQQTVRRKLTKWYIQVALQHLRLRVTNRVDKMLPGVTPPAIKARDYKRRWGSCDQRGDLSFNWRIVMAPSEVMDYVVIHEIAHIKEFNHSPGFWRIVEQQMPDWRIQQRWLSDNGSLLYRF